MADGTLNIAELGIGTKELEEGLRRANAALRGIESEAKKSGKAAEKASEQLNTLTSWAKGFATFSVVSRAIGAVSRELMDWERETAKMNGMLRLQGDQAVMTAQRITTLATSLERTTLFEGGQITDAATELARFGTVSGSAFERTIRLAADMSQVLGTDVVGATRRLGRVLENPIKNAIQLEEAGASLTAQQMRQIEVFTALGERTKAQGVVLDALEGKFKGVAAEMNTGMLGATTTLSDEWKNFLETLGRTEGFDVAGDAIRRLAETMRGVQGGLEDVMDPRRAALVAEQVRLTDAIQTGTMPNGRTKVGMGPEVEEARRRRAEVEAFLAQLDEYLRWEREAAAFQEERANRERDEAGRRAAATAAATAAKEAAKAHGAAVATAAEAIREEIIGLTLGAESLEQYKLQKLLAGEAPPATSEDELQDLIDMARVAREAAEAQTALAESRARAAADSADPAQLRANADYRESLGTELEVRSLRARGMHAEADAAALRARHQREYVEALHRGASFEEITALERVQAEEQAQQQTEIHASMWEATWGQVATNVQNGFASTFEAILSGEIKTLREFGAVFLDMWAKILMQMAAATAASKVTDFLFDIFKVPVPKMHSGGVVGGGDVPRYHNGLAPDEMPAILQRGEMVLSRTDTASVVAGVLAARAGGLPRGGGGRAGGASITIQAPVTFQISAVDGPSVAAMLEAQGGTIVGVVAKAVRQSRAMGQLMAGAAA